MVKTVDAKRVPGSERYHQTAHFIGFGLQTAGETQMLGGFAMLEVVVKQRVTSIFGCCVDSNRRFAWDGFRC